jgi:hypothetical protein
MGTLEELDREGLTALLASQGRKAQAIADALAIIEGWVERGDVALVYENQEFGHPEQGDVKIVSHGGPGALLEFEVFPQYPTTLPDIGGDINWRYQLVAVHRGDRDDIVTEFLKQGAIIEDYPEDES